MALCTVVADADPLARRLTRLVLQDAGASVLAEARTAAEAVELVLRHAPDVAVIDAGGPALEGVDAVRAIHARQPGQLIVVLSRDEDEETALLALRAGACGFLSKEVAIDALPRALAGVMAGEAAVSRRLERRLVARLRHAPREAHALRPIKSPLTAREWEIVDVLAPGRTTDDVASALVISNETVRSHVKSIMRKLDVHSRRDAVEAARELRFAAV